MSTQNPMSLGLDYARNLAQVGNQVEQRNASRQNQQIQQQQQERNQVLQGQQDQAGAYDQAQKQASGLVQLSQGLMQLPIEQRMQAIQEQAPMLERLDIDIAGLTPEAITDEGLTRIISALGGGGETPEIGTYNPRDYTTESFAEFSKSGNPSDLQRYAAGKTVTIAGVQYDYDPATRSYKEVTIGGGPESQATPGSVQPEATPLSASSQIEQQANIEAAKTTAIGEAKAGLAQGDPELVNRQNKEETFRLDTISVIDNLLDSEVGKITGTTGRLPTFFPETEDMLVQADRLASLLTADNMDIMSGVLSETDIKIIGNLAGGFGLIKNDKGEPIKIKGSEEAFRERMNTVKKGLHAVEIVPQLTAEMPSAEEGTVVTDTKTDYQFIFKNGRWIAK